MMKKHIHVGEVIDPSYWQAWEENNILDCIEQVKRDYLEKLLKFSGWFTKEN